MDRAEAITPTAAALVTAVARQDAEAIRLLLGRCRDLPALAVVLADNVGCLHDPRLLPREPVSGVRRVCVGCHRETRSTVGLCQDCSDPHSSASELTGGTWVRDPARGVQVYVA